ncbi:conserved hypothetical protein [metagenome]|uniref:Glycosyltransferase n=1 Tax=metagenome TaxID=256318 RepID=A0A2P2C169_9ZZZZ
MTPRGLVVAKAPVAGSSKTRLGVDIGMAAAADVAAAALLDTVRACTEAFGAANCHLALEGRLAGAVEGTSIARQVRGWNVFAQHPGDFGSRLANAHFATGPGPVVQIGMDTPQVQPSMLREAAAGLQDHDAVLGPAEDGGWWVLALRDPQDAALLVGVPMSTPDTLLYTREALESAGMSVGTTRTLRDVDTVPDAEVVATEVPDSHFARAWARTGRR